MMKQNIDGGSFNPYSGFGGAPGDASSLIGSGMLDNPSFSGTFFNGGLDPMGASPWGTGGSSSFTAGGTPPVMPFGNGFSMLGANGVAGAGSGAGSTGGITSSASGGFSSLAPANASPFLDWGIDPNQSQQALTNAIFAQPGLSQSQPTQVGPQPSVGGSPSKQTNPLIMSAGGFAGLNSRGV